MIPREIFILNLYISALVCASVYVDKVSYMLTYNLTSDQLFYTTVKIVLKIAKFFTNILIDPKKKTSLKCMLFTEKTLHHLLHSSNCVEKWYFWHRIEAECSINTKPLNLRQQQPDQGCLLISWHELATNPITQNPRRSLHPSQEAQRESTNILPGYQQSFHWNQISFRKHIEIERRGRKLSRDIWQTDSILEWQCATESDLRRK